MTSAPIIDAITKLVQTAPTLDPVVIDALGGLLDANATPLAAAIAQVIRLVGAGQIEPGIALPALAMACATLVDPRLTTREHEAARFEIETLLPLPQRVPRVAAPDVPVDALRRR